MKLFTDMNDTQIVAMLQAGNIGVIRTDTLYGVICMATNESAVERIYSLKGRDDHKSPIVLVGNKQQLFDTPTEIEDAILEQVWPGPVSVILPSSAAPAWIKRDNDSVAYRLPDDAGLQSVLNQVGPLIAPSANPQGEAPALSIEQAEQYFGQEVDFYVDGGRVTDDAPSKLLRIATDGSVERLR